MIFALSAEFLGAAAPPIGSGPGFRSAGGAAAAAAAKTPKTQLNKTNNNNINNFHVGSTTP